jgi:hypothetical protein
MAATLASVLDTVSPGLAATVNCPALVVPAGGSLTCTYGPVNLPDGSRRLNTAEVSLANNDGGTTEWSTQAIVDFAQAEMELVDEEVDVYDSFWGEPQELLGTVRYDEVPATFTYSRTIPATGIVCGRLLVPNTSALETNDTGITIQDDANISVEVYELCSVAAAYEDLPYDAAQFDWDYNDWVSTIELEAQSVAANGGVHLARLDFAFNPEARGAAYDHEFHVRFPAGTFQCDGISTLTLLDQGGNTLDQDVNPFDASVLNDFNVIWTAQAFDDQTNTEEGPGAPAYVPTRVTALLRLDFPEPCPFDLGTFDPATAFHGQGLFFEPVLHVVRTGQNIGVGDDRTLIVPQLDWAWPEERVEIWNAYQRPYVNFLVEDNPPPTYRPTFQPDWWEHPTDCVYGDGTRCPLLDQ